MSNKDIITLLVVVILCMLFTSLVSYKSGSDFVRTQVRDYALINEKAYYDSKTGKILWNDKELQNIYENNKGDVK